MKKLLPVLFFALCFSAKAQTFSSSAQLNIPDIGAPVYVPITVSGLPAQVNSSFGIISACFNIVHPYTSDLVIKLKAPDGTEVTLAGGVGGGGGNFTNTCLAMNGSSYLTLAAAPFTGTFIPQQSINGLNNNQDPNGTWTFIYHDTYAADTGYVDFSSITFGSNPPADPGPPPILCPTCVCPTAGGNCDLLPDMTASGLIISESIIEISGNVNFGNATPNIGWGPMEIHGVDSCYCDGVLVPCSATSCPGGSFKKQRIHQRIYHKAATGDTLTYYDRPAGLMSYHPTHGHIHVDNWADFSLRKKTSNPDARTWPIIGTGTKQSFCLINLGDCSANPGYCVRLNGDTLTTDSIPNFPLGYVSGCGTDQGIYTGHLDIYTAGLNQGIDLSGTCNGNFYIVSITDPNNDFLEYDEENNWTAVPVTLGQQANAGPTDTCSFLYIRTDNTFQFLNTTPFVSGPFFWDFGDGVTDTVENPIHTYATNGNYMVTLELLTQCRKPDTAYIFINTGIENTTHEVARLEVMPNPFNQKFTVQFVMLQKSDAKLEVVDLLGRTVYSQLVNAAAPGRHETEMDLSSLEMKSGIYLLRLTGNGAPVFKKIVKLE